MSIESEFSEGIRLFNAQKYFEAHEALEAVWLQASGDRKVFLHGLIQVAAAFHHHLRGNHKGFGSLLKKGCARLDNCRAESEGLDLAGLMLQLQAWQEYVCSNSLQGNTSPPLPQIKLLKNSGCA